MANAGEATEHPQNLLADALRGLPVVVTGGAGYVGSAVAHDLARRGARVLVLDDLSAGHAWAARGLELRACDVRDEAALERALRGHGARAVCHLAAQANIPESYADPARCHAVNVGGTEALLRAMERAGVRALTFASTCAVYAPPAPGSVLREGDPEAPESPYARSKLAAERSIARWVERGLGDATCFRFFNAAGADREAGVGEAHEPETHVIPRVLRWLAGEGTFAIYGDDYPTDDGTCVRDYVHVSDLADAHARSLARTVGGREVGHFDVVNIGSGVGTTVHALVDQARRVAGSLREPLVHPRREGDAPRLLADTSRARALLGWSPRRGLEQILADALWWEQNRAGVVG